MGRWPRRILLGTVLGGVGGGVHLLLVFRGVTGQDGARRVGGVVCGLIGGRIGLCGVEFVAAQRSAELGHGRERGELGDVCVVFGRSVFGDDGRLAEGEPALIEQR